jgi:NAD(P)-dependent dehydrogenase (short-subunit alcohol dehydrogenase family)
MPGEQTSQFGGTSPMGRPAQPAELAPTFVFLASQESSFVNGETLGVTGGQPLP